MFADFRELFFVVFAYFVFFGSLFGVVFDAFYFFFLSFYELVIALVEFLFLGGIVWWGLITRFFLRLDILFFGFRLLCIVIWVDR